MFSFLLDFFFPRRSLRGQEGEWVTAAERVAFALQPMHEGKCALQARGLRALDGVLSAAAFDRVSLLQTAIHACKYRRLPGVASALSQCLVDALTQRRYSRDAVLCPVPLHWTRRFSRGFNQAELLAKHIGTALQLPVRCLLRRTRPTGHQAWRNRQERLTAVHDAFRCRVRRVPKHVILIDDVTTTGATLEACAMTLKEAGVTTVEAWTVAHG